MSRTALALVRGAVPAAWAGAQISPWPPGCRPQRPPPCALAQPVFVWTEGDGVAREACQPKAARGGGFYIPAEAWPDPFNCHSQHMKKNITAVIPVREGSTRLKKQEHRALRGTTSCSSRSSS